MVLVLVRVYDYAKELAVRHRAVALHNAHELLRAERPLHLDFEHAANVSLAGHRALTLLASYWYQFAHITVALSVLAWCWWRWPEIYRGARDALVLINVVGLLVFVAYPVMPPRLLPGGRYVDSVAAAGFGSTHGGPVPADQYAAMPSLHLGWATWVTIVVWRGCPNRAIRALAVLYPVLTTVSVVTTANHYLLDVVAGVAVGFAAAMVTGTIRGPRRLVRRLSLRREPAGCTK